MEINRTYGLEEIMDAMAFAYGHMTNENAINLRGYLLDKHTFPIPYNVIKTEYGTIVSSELRSL